MATQTSPVDVTSAASIASAPLPSSRRGYDRDEVRALLDAVAAEVSRLQRERDSLAAELEEAKANHEPPPLDEATVTGLLGEETARVLATAREAASQIRERAEENVARLLREAQDDAARMREEASLDAMRRRQEAMFDAEEQIDAAKQEGRQMVSAARAVRERMLSDLARRRDSARAQLERIRAERDRLVAAFDDAGRTVDDVIAGLRAAAPEAAPIETVEEAVAAVAEPEDELVVGEVAVEELVVGDDADDHEDGEAEPHAVMMSEAGGAPALSFAGELDARDGADVSERAEATDDADTVDSLFARLRAASTADVVAGPGPAEDPDLDLLAARAAVIEPIQVSLARRIKRGLADEQNEVLDALRRTSGVDALALFGGSDAYAERYRAVAEDDLWAAAVAGAASWGRLDGDAIDAALAGAGVLDALLDEVVTELAVPLRARLEQCLEGKDGDAVETGTALRAAYREWKTQRTDELAGQLVLTAHGRGAFAALEPGTLIRWVVDPDGVPCPDADDNALGGTVPAGAAFPTGHCHAPAHPGCRCGIAIIDR